MTFTIIGAGNVATHLAQRLYEKGGEIKHIFSRNKENAKTLAKSVNACYTNNLTQINLNSDVYIFAVSDNAIESVLQNLPKNLNKNAVFLHTAGSVSIEMFKNFEHYGVLYPLQTFSKNRPLDFAKIPVFIEGNSPEATEKIQTTAQLLSDKIYTANSEQRKKLHLAAVFACNFVNAMYLISDDLLQDADLPFEALLALIEETATKIATLSPYAAQTGPAVRGDTATMEKHLQMLKNNVHLQQIYSLISQEIQQQIKKMH